jgi:hypothetical protein
MGRLRVPVPLAGAQIAIQEAGGIGAVRRGHQRARMMWELPPAPLSTFLCRHRVATPSPPPAGRPGSVRQERPPAVPNNPKPDDECIVG